MTADVAYRVPLDNPKPDADRFIRYMMGKDRSGHVPMVEYIVDAAVMRPIVTQLLGREWVPPTEGDKESQAAYLDNCIEFWYRMGYDFVRIERSLPFHKHRLFSRDTAAGSDRERSWADEHQGVITCWGDFERYAWPLVEEFDFSPYEYIDSHLPNGMGIMASHAGGILEWVTQILSYERLCLALYENPRLVEAVTERVGTLMVRYYEQLLDLENLVAVFPGDDMGFRTGTLVSPNHLRQYFLPWHRRFAAMAHDKGLPYFLHSCGNLEAITDDLIEDVGIDGKHSFEDAILPAPDFQQRYGHRVATLGGIDVHVLSTASPGDLRAYVRGMINACATRGRYAVGSGNSIPSYVPVENYLTMVDEALRQ